MSTTAAGSSGRWQRRLAVVGVMAAATVLLGGVAHAAEFETSVQPIGPILLFQDPTNRLVAFWVLGFLVVSFNWVRATRLALKERNCWGEATAAGMYARRASIAFAVMTTLSLIGCGVIAASH